MSELRHDQENILQFPIEAEGYIDPEFMKEKEILERFVSQLTHPGVQTYSMSELSEFIIDTSGVKPREDLPENRLAWREKMKKIRDENLGLSDSAYDALVDIDDERYDEGFALLEGALRATRNNAKELERERHAIFILMDLRIAAIRHKTDDAEKWTVLAKKLNIS